MPGKSVAERLDAATMPEPNSGCWLWTRPLNRGYGRLRVDGRNRMAHRLSYQRHVGDLLDALTIHHLCRNRACINPAHLEAVPLAVNVMRGFGAPASHARKTACVNGHALDEGNTLVTARGWRICRACYESRLKPLTPGDQRRVGNGQPWVRACVECGRVSRIQARGLCSRDYDRRFRPNRVRLTASRGSQTNEKSAPVRT